MVEYFRYFLCGIQRLCMVVSVLLRNKKNMQFAEISKKWNAISLLDVPSESSSRYSKPKQYLIT